jgi:hypothetical protein
VPTRTLDVALWEYRDDSGRKRRAYYRQTFDLSEAEVARGERAGVFALSPRAVDLPAKSSTNRELIDWLVTNAGAPRAEIKGLTKAELWQHITDAEHVAPQHDSHDEQP